MAEPHTDLDAEVRKADPDRWLSSRFIADAALRADVIAVYAFDSELASVVQRTSQPMLGEIRLAWWREALEEIAGGSAARAHPVLLAMADVRERRNPDFAPLIQLAEARLRDLDPAPIATDTEAIAYVGRTAGAVAVTVARLLDRATEPHSLSGAARAWGISALVAAGRFDPARGASIVRTAKRATQSELRGLSSAAFPAVAHAALALPSLRRPGPLEARLRLVLAVARGAV